MSSQAVVYDEIADHYQDSKQLPFRRVIEEYTLFQLLGDVTRQSVLDLACGDGIYSRKIKMLGAGQVLGIDISSKMIELAETQEKSKPLGIEYLCQDISSLRTGGEFDLAVASYLLNYAKTKDELKQFCESIFRNLKPGGRLVGFNNNPANGPEHFHRYKKYGFSKTSLNTLQEGSPITYTLFNLDGTSFSFDNYYLSLLTHEEVFKEVGFRSFKWHLPQVSPEGIQQMGQEYWQSFMDYPPLMGLEAIK